MIFSYLFLYLSLSLQDKDIKTNRKKKYIASFLKIIKKSLYNGVRKEKYSHENYKN